MKRLLPLLLAGASLLRAETAAEFAARARAVHERIIVLDTHLDTPANFSRPGWDIMDRHSYDADRSQVDYPRMVEGGLDGGFWAIFTAQGPRTPAGLAAARDKALVRAIEIREMVAKNVVMRQVPLLTFVHDNSAPRAVRVEQLLEDIDRKEGKP